MLDEDGTKIEPRSRQAGSSAPSDPGFDDSGWRSLDLPHDWGIEGPFDINLEGPTGKLPWVGIGWYRKSFTLPAEDGGKRIFLDVDGALMDGNSPDGWKMADKLRRIIHDEDPTRPVTMGNNSPQAGKHLWRGIDLMGYNYKPHLYQQFHDDQPETPVYGSETASCVSSRGIYFFPVDWDKGKGFFDFQVSSYDLYAPGWAMRPDIEFKAQDECRPFVFGEYVWTGFDYLGEPTPFNKDATNILNFHSREERERAKRELERTGKVQLPSRSSYFGIIDLAGMPKDRFFLYQARWRPELPMAHILPHWNWPQRRGETTPVHVYTSGDEPELSSRGGRQRPARRCSR